ncbi:MAG: Sua5/YciO/YrdC/YwlC family protein [Phycisphaerales bacterium]
MTTLNIRSADEAARAQAADRAGEELRSGRLVALPTETVYGLAGDARTAGVVGAIRQLTGLKEDAPLAWHAPGSKAVREAVPLRSAMHRRAVERLGAGPVTFMIEATPDELAQICAALGVPGGVIDNGAAALVRIPGHPFARAALAAAGVPVVIAGASPKGVPAPTDARLGFDEASQARIALLVDDGPTTLRKPSTLVRLTRDGGLTVVREGAVDERLIRKRLARTLLFVCSGNTCRSPMAAAIANALARERFGDDPTEPPVHAESAGTSAMRGGAQTPEGVRALRDLGVPVDGHESRPLTRELIEQADRVFVMTPDHLRAARGLVPDLADRIELLDPEGEAIPDPIGMDQSVYTQTAERLRDLIARRLDELAGPAHAARDAGDDR